MFKCPSGAGVRLLPPLEKRDGKGTLDVRAVHVCVPPAVSSQGSVVGGERFLGQQSPRSLTTHPP